MTVYHFRNFELLDPDAGESLGGFELVVEGDRIKEVSAKLLTQFVQCLEAKLNAAPDAAAQTGAQPGANEEAAGGPDPALAVAADGQPVAAPVPAMAGVQAPQAGQAPLNLISVAGGAIYKRLIPVAIAVIVIIVVIILVVR